MQDQPKKPIPSNYVSEHSRLMQSHHAQPAAKLIPWPVAAEPVIGIEQQVEQSMARFYETLGSTLPAPGLYDRVLAQLERPLILHTLRATHGNQIKAAEILGINRNTLRKKMRLLGIQKKAAA